MKIILWLSVIMTSTTFIAVETDAAFVNNYAKWRELPSGFKSGYAAAALDHEVIFTENDPAVLAKTEGISKCAQDLSLTTSMIVEAIDAEYRNAPDKWSYPPLVMAVTALTRICKTQINDARKARGLAEASNWQ